jgi:hypothetical protein
VVSVSKNPDAIDDIFGESTPKQSTIEDDFFSEPSSVSTKPAVKADDAEPFVAPAKKPSEPIDNIFGESHFQGSLEPTAVSEPTPETTEKAAGQPKMVFSGVPGLYVEEPPTPVGCPPIDMSYGAEAMEGFDQAVFEKINSTAHEMLHWLPNDDIGHLSSQISEYAVAIDLDHLREHPTILSDKLMEIQSKRDGLYTQTIRWRPVFTATKHAEKYILSAGMIATKAGSADKRQAQIRAAIPAFWKRHSDLLSLESTIQQTHEHLCGWYECLSRLISSMQINNKIGEISRGEMPFDGPYKKAPQTDLPDTPEVNSEMSQPISVPKHSGCQSFANVGKQTGSKKFKAGDIEW